MVPQTHRRYFFVDIGGGVNGRGRQLSEKLPHRKFAIVEHNRRFIEADQKLGERDNLTHHYEDAKIFLKRQPDHSVDHFNMDITAIHPTKSKVSVRIQRKMKREKKQELEPAMYFSLTPKVLREIKRVLKPDGVLFLTVPKEILGSIEKLLFKGGFEVKSEKLAPTIIKATSEASIVRDHNVITPRIQKFLAEAEAQSNPLMQKKDMKKLDPTPWRIEATIR